MMWRINPDTSQVAVLSFPRDLWVTIDGRSSQQRINVAYERDNPQKLINTIYQNFGIVTDHFIQVDFCAFQKLVDAVDGVTVPFATPVRDPNTGLNVPEAGCFTFDGDHALAYVRSRKMQSYTDEDGWVHRRHVGPRTHLAPAGLPAPHRRPAARRRAPSTPTWPARSIETVSEYIVTDPTLTPRKMLEFAGVMSKVDPTAITTYQIEARDTTIQGNSVLVPDARRRQHAERSSPSSAAGPRSTDAPDQVFDTTTVPARDHHHRPSRHRRPPPGPAPPASRPPPPPPP